MPFLTVNERFKDGCFEQLINTYFLRVYISCKVFSLDSRKIWEHILNEVYANGNVVDCYSNSCLFSNEFDEIVALAFYNEQQNVQVAAIELFQAFNRCKDFFSRCPSLFVVEGKGITTADVALFEQEIEQFIDDMLAVDDSEAVKCFYTFQEMAVTCDLAVYWADAKEHLYIFNYFYSLHLAVKKDQSSGWCQSIEKIIQGSLN